MARYRYKAKNTEGKVVRGIFFAEDEEELREILANQEYYLVRHNKISESSQIFSFLETIKIDDLTNFCRQFGIMLRAGISISNCIDSLKETTKNKKLKTILESVYRDILNGVALSEAFSKYPKTFPSFFINMTSIGEISGSLDSVMLKLADYYEKDAKTKRKAKTAMAYPTFLMCLVVAVVFVLSVFVMPMFENLFNSFDAELPTITKVVIDVTSFIKFNFGVIVLVIFLLVFLFSVIKNTKGGRLMFDKFKLNAPIISKITRAVITSRFASGFSTLLQSGVNLVDAIDLMGRLLGNKAVEEKFATCKSELKRGQKVAKAIETINVFPNMLIEMVSVGEASGQLETVLDTTAAYFEDQVDREIKKATSIIEPVMIITIALIVVIVLLSVFLPMLGLMDAIENSTGV